MKKLSFILFVLTFFVGKSNAQIKTYGSSSGELIFSFADYKINDQQITTPVRFTCFFHAGAFQHFDFNNHVGLYTGGAIRNVGFTSTTGDTMIKRRNYYIGVPLAIKLGNMGEDTYLYGGVEGEFALHYKQKLFYNDEKVAKSTAWFSNRTNMFMPSAFIGVNLKGGLNIKFKYYLTDFYNKEYTENGVKIYDNTKSQMFYFSLSMNIRHSVYVNQTYNKGI